MTTKRQWLRGRAGVLVAAVGLLLWAEIVGLSSVLYQGCASPLVANGFTVAFSLGMLAAVAALSLVAARAPKGVGRFAARAFPLACLGCGMLEAVSLLWAVGPASSGSAVYLASGALTGVGAGLLVSATVPVAVMFSLRELIASLMAAFAAASFLFLGAMALLPTQALRVVLVILPAVALAAVALADRRVVEGPSSGRPFALSSGKGKFRVLCEQRNFVPFVGLSGLLWGYCYAIFPKSTRFGGVLVEAAVGSATAAALVFLAACVVTGGLLLAAIKWSDERGVQVLVSLLIVALAVLSFSLPYMPNNWMLFVMLNCAAMLAAVFSLLGILRHCALGRGREAGRLAATLFGCAAAGAVVAAAWISLTVDAPAVVLPVVLRDILIVGLPTVGFVALAVLLLQMSQSVVFPPPARRDGESVSLSDLAQAAKLMEKKFALTAREGEILALLLQGRSGPYIAEEFYLSNSTVKTHIRHIYDKVGVSSRQQLIDIAHKMCG